MRVWVPILLVLCAAPSVMADEPIVLRFASVVPDGSLLGRELRRFTDDLEGATNGQVHVKWYLNGVAGDEMEQADRIAKGQLDGTASGAMFCNQIIPSMRVTRLPGVFHSREEAADVLNRLNPALEKEAHEHGFVLLTSVGLGPDVILTRRPVHSFAELRRVKLWRWDLDEVGIVTSREMGLQIEPLPLADAARAYDAGRIDGYLAIPLAALAFQWSARARYVTDLRGSYIWGCFVVTERAVNRLPLAHQQALREASARARERFEDVGKQADEALIGGLFARQGLAAVPPTESFRNDYMAAAKDARASVAGHLVAKELIARVMQMLADYRLEHADKH